MRADPPSPPSAPLPPGTPWPASTAAPSRWQRFAAASLRAFHAYASWLVSISWRRFALLSLMLLVAMAILEDLPPFNWTFTEHVDSARPASSAPATLPSPQPPAPPSAPAPPKSISSKSVTSDKPIRYEVTINKDGVRITPREPASAPSSAASAAEAASAASLAASAEKSLAPSVTIPLPDKASAEEVKAAVEEARAAVEEAVADAREAAADAAQAAAEAAREAADKVAEQAAEAADPGSSRRRVVTVRLGDYLVNIAFLFILASALVKITYKGRIQAEVKAAQATETAESESLKRQVVEARMAAMQAQVEPHFLFNTLASIDHLIETDPPRASVMQKNLISLLRASMPSMREANGQGNPASRDLGRELAVIRPYLEILKVRMEERLQTEIRVSEGLLSAEFPPMMLQSLVENAIKHGLEPKAEGGRLTVAAEIVHGKLAVSVTDTGLGFGKAATAGTGIGLNNIRERLQLLYGHRASLKVAENPGGGTAVTITVPYQSHHPHQDS